MKTQNDRRCLKTPELKMPQSWSPDGRYIVYAVNDPKTKLDLWVLPLFGDRKPFPFARTEFNEIQGQISPNGRWMAYASDESGAPEVYVRSFGEREPGKWRISVNGGSEPMWRRDGTELFYLAADRKLMAVSIDGEAAFKAGPPVVLFETRQTPVSGGAFETRNTYVVSSDGQQFLIDTPTDSKRASPVTVVLNWQSALGARERR